MNKEQKKKELITYILFGGLIAAIFIFAIWQFLGTKDCYGLIGGPQTCLTGWEALKLQWPSFWWFAWGGLIVGTLLMILAYYNESGKGWIGRRLRGNTNLTIALAIIALLLMCTPWGRACTDKSNGGITAPGHKVELPKQ